MIPVWIYYFLLIELIVVSYLDLRTKTIKNIWSIINLSFFLIFLFLYKEHYPFVLTSFVYSLSFLLVGFLLFLVKIMGAGDTKYLFSFFLVSPVQLHDEIFNRLLVFTTLCAFIFLIFNVLKNFKKLYLAILTRDLVQLKSCFGTKFAFAPVILISWIWLGLEGGHFAF